MGRTLKAHIYLVVKILILKNDFEYYHIQSQVISQFIDLYP